MALVKGTNSYATVAEADAYFLGRLESSLWTAANNTTKEQALQTATRVIDEMSWAGTAVSEDQPLAFPRVVEYFDPKVGTIIYLDGTTVPERIILNLYEIALHLLSNDGILADTGGVTSLSVGPIRLDQIEKANKVPLSVKRSIKPLLLNGGSNTWWRAN